MRRLLAVTLSLAALAAACSSADADPVIHRPPERRASLIVEPSTPQLAVLEHDAVLVGQYVTALQADEVGRYVVAVAAAEEAARVAAAEAAARASAPTASSGSTARTPAGGHSDAWWQGVAICEQGGRNDPYFGYFSFMDGSQGGRPWDEQVAAGNALLAAAGREVGPWAESCVNAGYAASPGG